MNNTRSTGLGKSESSQEMDPRQDPVLLTLISLEEIENLKSVFELFDLDGGGTISIDELKEVMRALGQTTSEEELRIMISEADKDGSMEIDFYEFVWLMAKKMNEKEEFEELEQVFK